VPDDKNEVVVGRILFGHHHLHEFFVVDLTISINVRFTDHLINFFVSELLSEVCHDMTKFSSGDESVSILVENFEGFEDLFFAVGILHLAGHHRQEFREVDSTTAIGVNLQRTERKISRDTFLRKCQYRLIL
jgi:hypothetical protein